MNLGGIGVIFDLLLIAVLIEALIEVFKGALARWEWVAIALGVMICTLAGLDVFGLRSTPLVVPGVSWLGGLIGSVLTGVLASRGANFLYDVWRRVRTLNDGNPPMEANRDVR